MRRRFCEMRSPVAGGTACPRAGSIAACGEALAVFRRRPREASCIASTLCLFLALTALASGCHSLVWYGYSPDRRRRVEVVETPRGQAVLVGGTRGPVYQAIGVEGLSFSPDGRQLAYPARRSPGQWYVVADGGATFGPFAGVGELRFSPDGRRLAFVARKGAAWHVVLDGREGPPLEAIYRGTLQFTPSGARLVFVARRGGSTHVFVDQRPSPPFRAVSQLRVGRGERVAFVARSGASLRVAVDGRLGEPWSAVRSLTVSPDGGRVGFFAEREGRWVAVVDGRVSQAFDELAGLRFSADGRHVAWAGRRGGRAVVVEDFVEGPPMDGIRFETLRFDVKGHLLVVVRQGRQYRVVHAGRAGPDYDAIEPPVASPFGHRWGYLARRGDERWLVLDGAPNRLPSDLVAVHDLRLAPDGKRYAFVARHKASDLVVHDRGAVRFDRVILDTLTFAAEPESLAPRRNGARPAWRWACLAGERATRELFVAVEGIGRVAFDLEELTAVQMRHRGPLPVSLLRRWVGAELRLALERHAAAMRPQVASPVAVTGR